MKKNIIPLALGLSLLMAPATSFAESSENGALTDVPISNLEQQENDELIAEKDKAAEEWEKNKIKNGNKANASGQYYSISVSNYKQERTYWCGPAAVRQSLSFHKSKSGSSASLPSQSTLASKAGTSTAGSSSYGLKNALNAYKSTYKFSSNPYGTADIAGYSNPTSKFESRIKYVLSNKINAPIVLITSEFLPRYGGKDIRHYNTISAYSYSYSTGKKSIKMVDPHYSSTYRGAHWDPLGSTTSNGVVKAVYEADREGSNPVMVY
ncbi:C39 family peptidase (plasmid) [Bacillus carboniphilus]|uniref:C39 family peptidase n=1 Tax=Bacillus carboniphilus TaxID=86663 RepID=A0ABY9JYD0_9BACI|nr:C39 family peptidase [Bacillus carboniphilus]WLR44392.1 C39 family peptidase [Bacillus carboniphilus]